MPVGGPIKVMIGLWIDSTPFVHYENRNNFSGSADLQDNKTSNTLLNMRPRDADREHECTCVVHLAIA